MNAAPPVALRVAIIFFRLTSLELGLLFFGVILGATGLGIFLGHRVRHLSQSLKEPFGILQGALLGLVGLLLAFGLSLAVSRYLGASLALGLLAAYLAIVGRGVLAVLLAATLVAFLLLVTADLDRPTRGMIRVPDTALTNQLTSMTQPPAAAASRLPRR
jgi:hypothetical protein